MLELFAQTEAGAGFAQFLLLGLVMGALYALIALGYTMVYGIIELINFAHGDLFMLGSFLALSLAGWVGVSTASGRTTTALAGAVLLMLVAAPLFCAALNVAVDRVFYKPLRASPKLTVIVTAIGVSFVFMNAGSLWKGSSPVDFPDLIPNTNLLAGARLTWADVLAAGAAGLAAAGVARVVGAVRARGSPRPRRVLGAVAGLAAVAGAAGAVVYVNWVDPDLLPADNLFAGLKFTWKDAMVVGATVPAMAALTLFVRYAALGKAMRATAQNPTAALLMGIDVDRVIAVTFAIGGALAGIGAVVAGLYNTSAHYQMGFQYGLYAFTAAVLGGIGNIPGAVLGGLVIGVVGELSKAYLGTTWSEPVVFTILIVILVFRPAGLLGARTREKV